MAAIRISSNVFQCLSRSNVAVIHIVDSDQQAVAQRFFTPTRAEFGGISGEPFQDGKTSAPVLRNLSAYVECRVRRITEGEGHHAVVLMEVLEAEWRAPIRPLTIRESPWEYGGYYKGVGSVI